jgi:hypothetical protein
MRAGMGAKVYWGLVGALIGFGVLSLLSIGLPFVLVGMVLAVVGIWKFGVHDAWVALVACGVLDAAIVMHTISSAGPVCPASGMGHTQSACSDLPSTYVQIVVVAWCIAIIGVLVPAVRWIRTVMRPGSRTMPISKF